LEWNNNQNHNGRALWICPSSSPQARPQTNNNNNNNGRPPATSAALFIQLRIDISIATLTATDILAHLRIVFLMRASIAARASLPSANVFISRLIGLPSGRALMSFARDDFINKVNSWTKDTGAATGGRRLALRSSANEEIPGMLPRELQTLANEIGPEDVWISADAAEMYRQIETISRQLQNGASGAAGGAATDTGLGFEFAIQASPVNGAELPKVAADNLLERLNSTNPAVLLGELLSSPDADILGIKASAVTVATNPALHEVGTSAGAGSITSTQGTGSSSTKSGLSGGAIAGIVIGCVVAGTAMFVGGMRGVRKMRAHRNNSRPVRSSIAAPASAAAPAASSGAGSTVRDGAFEGTNPMHETGLTQTE
jgi:hypothetical protein